MRDREVQGRGVGEPWFNLKPGGNRIDSAPAQFVEQGQQPLLPGDFDGGVALGELFQGFMPFPVGGKHGVPGPGHRGVDRRAGRQLVVSGALAWHPQFGGAGKCLGGQDSADGAHEPER